MKKEIYLNVKLVWVGPLIADPPNATPPLCKVKFFLPGQIFMSWWYSLFAWSGKHAVTIEKIMGFEIIQDL